MDINQLLTSAVGQNASDMHIKVGSHPVIRVNGELMSLESAGMITQEYALAIISAMMTDSHNPYEDNDHSRPWSAKDTGEAFPGAEGADPGYRDYWERKIHDACGHDRTYKYV